VGQCPLVSGEIAEDVTKYFSASEQQSTAVALGVLVDVDYTVKEAGGLIVQVLPDPAEDVLRELEAKIGKLKSLTALMEESEDIYEVHKKIFGGIPMKIETTTHPELKCDCSRERMERALISIGKKDLQEIIDEDGEAELVCHFCRSHYRFTKEELEKLLAQI
jgi:molecular chaperone Hsp33